MSNTLPIFAGWNAWAVWQSSDLSFNPLMFGVSPERQLRIWVEDAVRLGAPGAKVADPIDLKGGQVEILPGAPSDLKPAMTKEQVDGGPLLLSSDADPKLFFVRFFNRGSASRLVWPHDDDYLLDTVFEPSKTSEVTQGPAPSTITETAGQGSADLIGAVGRPIFWALAGLVTLKWLLKK